MKNVVGMKNHRLYPRIKTDVLYTGRNPELPPNFKPCPGMLVWRDTKHMVSWWNGLQWFLLNSAGWSCTFLSPFPEQIPVGHWAVLGPVKFRKRGDWYQQYLTIDRIQWAFACPVPGGKHLNPIPSNLAVASTVR